LSNSGTAIMGSATASGKIRAQEAIMKALDSPLLNDNKITGAKNVLLLIVSGSQEITIDEIGEINDHIQSEAGHGANIIMGVGEDESLEESISVTIIATGFDIDQQHEISNTEQKKVIHALEDDRNDDVTVKENDPAIITPDIVLEKEEVENERVVHTLMEEEEDSNEIEVNNETELITTTEIIKNINVVYEEVLDKNIEDDFVITPVQEVAEDIQEETEEEQITLTFDLPLSAVNEEDEQEIQEEKTIFSLDDEIKDMDVNEHVEIVPVTEANEEGEKRYALDDFMAYESSINESDAKLKVQPEVEEEIVFEKKTVESEETQEEIKEELDPMNSPISEILKERADERRRKMKDFNYKFNSAKIDDIEKEPAYKRQGVNLEDSQHSSETKASRTSVATDDNDDIQLRSNNSFLHDNVD
ncbi:MAG: cell division protein FtsZ, partial [Psychroserpens sp.]|nr:cell division protein FtsZ [Psychroserpens sp.]